ncbi:MAG: HlyD family efflux transporter periplasmic adaptor subunit [Isosphaeraceae bacterium]
MTPVPFRPAASRGAGFALAIAIAVLVLIALATRGLAPISAGSADAQTPRSSSGAPARTNDTRAAAVALARLLPASGLIAVGARPGARVVELKVKEGDQVAASAILAVLEGHDTAQSQLAMARARKARADDEWTARLDAARQAAGLVIPRRDSARKLYNQFAATLKGKDRYDADMALHQIEMEAIKAELELKLLSGATAKGAPTEKDQPPARNPEAAALDAAIALAEAGLRDTEVRAPGPGRILRVLAHPGEVSAGSVLEMGDVSSMIARAEVYQSDVPRIQPGDPAEVDILGTKVTGKVTRIGTVVGKNQLVNIDPRAPRDLRVINVTIELDRPEPAGRFVDMEVEATIRPSGQQQAAANGLPGASLGWGAG